MSDINELEVELRHRPLSKKAKPEPDYRSMGPGAERRSAILAWLEQGRATGEERSIAVNRRYCLNLRYDDDLNRLLKKGLLVRRRRNLGVRSSPLNKRAGSFHTYLVLAPAKP